MFAGLTWVPVREAAESLGVSVQGVMYKVAVGKVRLRKVCHRYGLGRMVNVVNVDDLESWIEERKGDRRSIRATPAVATKRKQVLAKSGGKNVNKPRGTRVQGASVVPSKKAKRAAKVKRPTKGGDKGVSSR